MNNNWPAITTLLIGVIILFAFSFMTAWLWNTTASIYWSGAINITWFTVLKTFLFLLITGIAIIFIVKMGLLI